MNPIEVIKPGTEVVVNDIPARVAEVKIGTAMQVEYLLSWWDGRQFYTAWFDEDEFKPLPFQGETRIGIGFRQSTSIA